MDTLSEQGFPPLSFKPFGLSRAFTGRRWLETVDGSYGAAATGVWLSHLTGTEISPSSDWVSVGTVPLDVADVEFPHDLGELTARTAHVLGSYTEPRSGQLHDDYESYADHFQSVAKTSSGWNEVQWSVGGSPLIARTFEWAGAWIGLGSVDHFGIAAVASSKVPRRLELVPVDCALYHFQAERFMPMPATLLSSRRAVLRDDEGDVSWPWHPDHRRIRGWGDGRG